MPIEQKKIVVKCVLYNYLSFVKNKFRKNLYNNLFVFKKVKFSIITFPNNVVNQCSDISAQFKTRHKTS
jgi:hypothetical protein